MKSKVLVIDDDVQCLESAKRLLNNVDRAVEYFQTPEEALSVCKDNPYLYSLAFVDHNYQVNGEIKKEGVEIAKQLKSLNPMITICIVSGDSSEEAVRVWLSSSVDHYRYKPLRLVETVAFAEHYIKEYERNFSPINLESRDGHGPSLLKQFHKNMVGESQAMEECCEKALRFAKSNLNVLLLGETGTGKELFAQGIHRHSENSPLLLYPVNCSVYSESSNLLEVELFGSEKGAFTGAEKKIGLFEAANGGTIFLDEIHHLSEGAQSSLLRVLQEKKVRRVGGKEERPVRFRLIAAGKPNLVELCEKGLFSPDLYYRLKGLDLVIPPLRERIEDIRPLILSFLKQSNYLDGPVKKVSKKALECFMKYNWPGNVRELKQLIEKLTILVDDPIITPKHFPENVRGKNHEVEGKVDLMSLDEEYKNKQKALILRTLNETNYSISESARRLGLGNKRSTLRSKMKQLRIADLSKNEQRGLLFKMQAIL